MAVKTHVPCIAHLASYGSIGWTSYYARELSQILLAKRIRIISIVLLWNMTPVIVFTNQEACNICQYNTGSIKHLEAQSTSQPSSDNSLAIDTRTFHHILPLSSSSPAFFDQCMSWIGGQMVSSIDRVMLQRRVKGIPFWEDVYTAYEKTNINLCAFKCLDNRQYKGCDWELTGHNWLGVNAGVRRCRHCCTNLMQASTHRCT